jgi:protein pelota
MQLVEQEGKKYSLRPEHLEDLWILTQFIDVNDKCFAKTERKVKVGSENNPKQVTKLIYVELLIERVSFEHEVLRISGKIQNETEFSSIGDHHTLSFTAGDLLEIEKKELLKHQKEFLDKALNSSLGKNLLVLLDKDGLLAAEFSEFSYTLLFEHSGLGSKKYTGEEINENEQKYKILSDILKREYSSYVFAGPGPWKESFAEYVSSKIGKKIESFSWQDLEVQSVQKVITEIQKQGLVQSSQLSAENDGMQKLLLNIEKGEKAAYGEKEVAEALDSGRIESLLLTTKYIEKAREEGKGELINDRMKKVEQFNGSFLLLRSEFEAGIQLDGLGGIGAVLRY